MTSGLKAGDAVKVWPRPGLLVQSHPDLPGRFMADSGEELPWSSWLHDRLSDGSISLTDPRTSKSSAKPAKDKG